MPLISLASNSTTTIRARYWRVKFGSSIISHLPRMARIVLEEPDGTQTNVQVFTSDNTSDSGTIPSNGSTYNYDAGSANAKGFSKMLFYNTFTGGDRSGEYMVLWSHDNTNFVMGWGGVCQSYSAGGLVYGTNSI